MKDQKKQRFRLQIEVFDQNEADVGQSQRCNNVRLRPLRSAKNIHELKRFDFDPQNVEAVIAERNFRKLRQLQLERQQLKQSWEILREGAVSAIAQKAEQIERLRAKQPLTTDQKLQIFQNELQMSQQVKNELQEQRQELLREFHEERSKYVELLSEKQFQIQNLYREINQIRRQLDYLEENDSLKNRRIRELQEENYRLVAELEEKSLCLTIRQPSQRGAAEDFSRVFSSSPLAGSVSVSIANSLDSLVLNEESKSIITEKIEEISKAHKEQLSEVRSYYEERIAKLRQSYQKQFRLPSQESAKHRYQTRSRKISKSSSNNKPDSCLFINMRDLQGTGDQNEESIERRPKMNDLRREIELRDPSQGSHYGEMFRKDYDADGDASSQFTAKYFENPFQFIKKNNSARSIQEISDHQVKTTLRIKNNTQEMFENKVTEQNQSIQLNQKEQFGLFDKNKGIFTVGLLSGIALASLMRYLLRRQ